MARWGWKVGGGEPPERLLGKLGGGGSYPPRRRPTKLRD